MDWYGVPEKDMGLLLGGFLWYLERHTDTFDPVMIQMARDAKSGAGKGTPYADGPLPNPGSHDRGRQESRTHLRSSRSGSQNPKLGSPTVPPAVEPLSSRYTLGVGQVKDLVQAFLGLTAPTPEER